MLPDKEQEMFWILICYQIKKNFKIKTREATWSQSRFVVFWRKYRTVNTEFPSTPSFHPSTSLPLFISNTSSFSHPFTFLPFSSQTPPSFPSPFTPPQPSIIPIPKPQPPWFAKGENESCIIYFTWILFLFFKLVFKLNFSLSTLGRSMERAGLKYLKGLTQLYPYVTLSTKNNWLWQT